MGNQSGDSHIPQAFYFGVIFFEKIDSSFTLLPSQIIFRSGQGPADETIADNHPYLFPLKRIIFKFQAAAIELDDSFSLSKKIGKHVHNPAFDTDKIIFSLLGQFGQR